MYKLDINKKTTVGDSENKFSIIVPTWNNLAYLQTLISSIRKNSFFKHEIILHINDGSDGTLIWAQSQTDIGYTHSSDNIGICKAMNLAAAISTTDYILYINDDMYVCPHWDKYLWDEIKSIGHNYFFLSGTMIEFFDTGNPCVIGRFR
jgi:glycosyltransferase involved in cell wall biosynthesis